MPIKIPDAETQLRSMDNWHIRTAITSLTPRVILKNMHRLREVARICNEFQARMVLEHPARFGSFALLPLPDVDGALEEITYALDILHLDGLGLFSSYGGRYLGDPLFDPVFDELNRRNAVVFIHPTHCEAPPETNLGTPPFVVEYVFDTTRAIVNLVFTGTLKRCPDIRLIVAHGGGAVPFLAQRISMLEGHRKAPEVADVSAAPVLRIQYGRLRCVRCKAATNTLGLGLGVSFRQAAAGEVDRWAYDSFNAAERHGMEQQCIRLFRGSWRDKLQT
jgi:predicted TIM-barrel fold metal-dependent hydrolase